jgi:hypothetical protein
MLTTIKRWLTGLLLATCALSVAHAQSAQAPAPEQNYTQQELDQMLAPIALYPDPLLTQILMAATYPLEVVKAARWSREHPGLPGDDAVRAVANEDWDPSVKSLVAFPRVLAMMDERIDWTEQLGEAFLAQEPYVLETVQALRRRAYAAGNLASNAEVAVGQEANQIVIQPVNPGIVYVPYYDPWVVYGTWWWPAYPPVRWAPWPGYVRPGISVGIYWGSGIRLSTGFFFGAFDWHRHRVDVVYVNNYYYHPRVTHNVPLPWHHEAAHRRGVAYHHEALRQRYPQPVTRAAPRPVAPRSAQPRTVRPRTVQPRTVQPRTVQPRVSSRRTVEPPRVAPSAQDVTRSRTEQRQAPQSDRHPSAARSDGRQPSSASRAHREAPRSGEAPSEPGRGYGAPGNAPRGGGSDR